MTLRHRVGRWLQRARDRLDPQPAAPIDGPTPAPIDGLTPEDVRLDARHLLERQGVGLEIAFVDVRDGVGSGIPGALRVPTAVIVTRRGELPDDAEALVLVCDDGRASTEAALRLRARGVPAFAVDGGLAAWRRAGGEVEPP